MSRITKAISEIYRINSENEKKGWINRIHPLSKFIVTIIYILVAVSFDKYDLGGIVAMSIYPIITMIICDISLKDCMLRLKSVFFIVCAVGIINPFMDHKELFQIFGITITGGLISMITLMIKGILSVIASYILIVTTSIEKICYALRIIHIPKIFVTVILLIYRYITLLLKEAEKVTNAYELRAPGEKGIKFKVWGALVGMLMLRSMDRSQDVYESMILRGYDGEYYTEIDKSYFLKSMLYFIIWITSILLLRIMPVFSIIGVILV